MRNLLENPYVNSVLAEAYIILVVSTIQLISPPPDTPDTFFTPIAALSLFVLSAAVMGYLFLGQPLQLYFNGQKEQAVSFFMKTVVTFAVITILVFIGITFLKV